MKSTQLIKRIEELTQKLKPVAFIVVAYVRMKAKYYRVSRFGVLPDYQGICVGKRLLDFIAELYTSQTKVPFYILTSNPQIIRGNMSNWKLVLDMRA